MALQCRARALVVSHCSRLIAAADVGAAVIFGPDWRELLKCVWKCAGIAFSCCTYSIMGRVLLCVGCCIAVCITH